MQFQLFEDMSKVFLFRNFEILKKNYAAPLVSLQYHVTPFQHNKKY